MKDFLKAPYYFLKNLQYNRHTSQIMKCVIRKNSNCIDIGCHRGRFFSKMIKLAPEGRHWAFEPLPRFYEYLQNRFHKAEQTILPYALSDSEGSSIFKYVKNSPGYSGFKKRTYHIPFPDIIDIDVTKAKLDTIIKPTDKIDFIKIDVEGAELEVLRGAENTIKRNTPFVLFEHGLGAAPFYQTRPENIYDFFCGCGMEIFTLKSWLQNKPALDKGNFINQFNKERNYYFLACQNTRNNITA